MVSRILRLMFPPKCVFCRKILEAQQSDLCHDCRENAPEFIKEKFKIPFVAGWTALWYYKDGVRSSLLRYKFGPYRSYAKAYGRMLAMKILQTYGQDFDLLSWVPISPLRRFRRGFDQVELIARYVGEELDMKPVKLLKKIRNTAPQSLQGPIAARRANVLGAYRVCCPDLVKGKRILLLDDIITTGATASECAKTLQLAGADKIFAAAVAAASHDKKQE